MNSSLPASHRTPASGVFRLGVVLAVCTFAACSSVVGGGEVTSGDTTQDAQLSDSAVDTQDTGVGDTALTDTSATDTSASDTSDTDAGSADVTTGPWTLFTLSQGGFCAPGTDCFSTWQLSTDGTVHTKKGGTNATKQLSGPDLATIKATLDQMAFLNKMKDGFTCGQPPTDISYSFSYALFGVVYQQDVTGCQLSGGQDGPLVQGIVALLKAY